LFNQKLEDYKQFIKNKKVAIIGLGISNTPLVKYLCDLGVKVSVFDSAEIDKVSDRIELLKDYPIKYFLGKNYLEKLKSYDIIFKTPIVRPDIKELEEEKKRGAIITSEMEVFIDLCPAEIFAITGSDGKTTTTSILYNVLKESGYNCWLGGNIGTPLLNRIDEIDKNDKVVLELSSFQLLTMKKSPHVSIITNLEPNHLDIHKSMEEYIEAKQNIYKFQSKDDISVFNFDNSITRKFINDSPSKIIPFSRKNKLDYGAYIENKSIIFNENGNKTFIVDTDDIFLPGVHNIENYLAIVSATFNYTKPEIIEKVAKNFKSVEHRNEFVREFEGVKYYNDSIGSSPSRTIASINSFTQKVILIAGGYDKNLSYDVMGKTVLDKVKVLILIGQTSEKIQASVEKELEQQKDIHIPIIKCESLETAIDNAKSHSQKNDIILLSPASASFDMFKNFEVRGNTFKEYVNNLK
jgi:UDP-N-acetylmuramoylalanine--D-glutamate ligase